MAVLVCGGAGYIGSHTCLELIGAGYDVIVADNLVNSCEEAVVRTRELAGKDFPFVKIDLCDLGGDRRAVCRSPRDRLGDPFRRAQSSGGKCCKAAGVL